MTDLNADHDDQPFKSDNTASNRCGFTLMNNQVGAVVAEVMSTKHGVTVTPLPSMIRVDASAGWTSSTTRSPRHSVRNPATSTRRVRGEHVDALRPDDPRGRPDNHVRQSRGRGGVHRFRPTAGSQ